MPNYHRIRIDGGCYFFTVVTYKRRPFLTTDLARPILKKAIRQVQAKLPFEMPAFCLLPDHLHCIWQMPSGDSDYSKRWSMIKRAFSKEYLAAGGREINQSQSRAKKREYGIWQRRFWEHRCRDIDDFYKHVHYTHYNPIKHKLVNRLSDWQYSTYNKFFGNGFYTGFDWDLFLEEAVDENIEFNE